MAVLEESSREDTTGTGRRFHSSRQARCARPLWHLLADRASKGFLTTSSDFAPRLLPGLRVPGTKEHALPVPSVFIVDASGTIRFVYSNPDYTVRLGADSLWKAASPLATRSAESSALIP
jgi:hypothetical protein